MTRSARFPRVALIGGSLVAVAIALAAWWAASASDPSLTAAQTTPSTSQAMPSIPADAFAMTVESVHDGDTIRAHATSPNAVVTDLASTRVRLIGIDAPETSPRTDCWAEEATHALTALTPPGSTIWATPDRSILDRYERHLLYLWTSDGRFVNGELVARGAAVTMTIAPNTHYADLLGALQSEAASARTGQWGACP